MMKVTSLIAFFLVSQYVVAQKNKGVDNSVKYIQDYYSTFSTGYDYEGKSVILSNNYKATFSDSCFTLTFDRVDENKILQKQTITIHLKEVIRFEPYGTDVVEILGDNPFILPVSSKLAFITKNKVYEININYELDGNVEQSKIYKSFNRLIETYKG